MTKKLEIWRLPPVMVIHLKRFQFTQTYRRKLVSLVEFPIEDLDLSSCVAPHSEFPDRYPMKKKSDENGSSTQSSSSTEKAGIDEDASGKPPSPSGEASSSVTSEQSATENGSAAPASGHRVQIVDTATHAPVKNRVRRGYTNTNLDQSRCLETNYDLYGVVNHQGALGGGHYTAYAKNFVDDQWYYYDDERVRVVEESRVVSPSAYLLFYIRSDMKGVQVKDMYPHNNKKITEEDIDRFVEGGDERRCQIM